MSKREKPIKRLMTRPSDFTFDELAKLLSWCGYSISSTGKTGGSRVAFVNKEGDYIRLHKPHPRNILKQYQVNDIILVLQYKGIAMSIQKKTTANPDNYLHYKDYIGSVEFSEKDEVFHGKVIGIKSLISFEGESVSEIKKDFHSAVDEYLEACAENGTEPERPFKGSFNVRVEADLHRRAALYASSQGISLNKFVEDAIRQSVSP